MEVIWNRLSYTREGYGVIIKEGFQGTALDLPTTEPELFTLFWAMGTWQFDESYRPSP